MSYKHSRRSVLQTLAVGAGIFPALAPFGRAFLPNAHAAAGGAPRRIVFFPHPNGLPGGYSHSSWVITPGATFETSELGPMCKPLERHRKDLVVIQNLESKTSSAFREETSTHRNADIMLFTGSEEGPKKGRYYGTSKNASLDVYLAEKIGKLATPKFPFIMPGVQSKSQSHTYLANGDWLTHNDSPYALYQQLFANLVTGAPGSVGPDPATVARLARKQSVLDGLEQDVAAFQRRLGKDDRVRAEIQLDAIRTMEKRLGTAPTPSAPVAGRCGKPPAPKQGGDGAEALVWKFPDSRHVPECVDAMIDLTVAALACDLTRIANLLVYGGDDHNTTCNFAPVSTRQGWHSLSHLEPNKESYLRAKTWLTEKVALLADKLKAIPEGDGTMLDNTLIVVAQELGYDHGYHSLQTITVGGRNLGVKTGQYIKAGETGKGRGTEMNRLLVGAARAMGLPDEQYGTEIMNGRGPLRGFLAG